MKKLLVIIIFTACASISFSQVRSFNDIFPNAEQNIKAAAFSESGYIKSSRRTSGFIILGNSNGANIDPQIIDIILQKNPGYLIEYLLVLSGKDSSSLLDAYNALGNIRGLKGRLYNSHTKKRSFPLFEEATRIAGKKQTTAIPDPAPASVLPQSEIVYIKLRDSIFGNTYYCAEMALLQNCLRYTLTNFKSLSYLFIPVIKEEKFMSQLYFEPIEEGLLIYGIAGADISDFLASRISIDSAISKRLTVIAEWAIDGITKKNR